MNEIESSLRLNQRTVLVTVDTARAVLGCDAEMVSEMIDDGRLRWVWDIGVRDGGRRRELRILARDLVAPDRSGELTPENAILMVLGTNRFELRGSEVERMLVCSAAHVAELQRSGHLTGRIVSGVRHIRRDSLQRFLEQRMVV